MTVGMASALVRMCVGLDWLRRVSVLTIPFPPMSGRAGKGWVHYTDPLHSSGAKGAPQWGGPEMQMPLGEVFKVSTGAKTCPAVRFQGASITWEFPRFWLDGSSPGREGCVAPSGEALEGVEILLIERHPCSSLPEPDEPRVPGTVRAGELPFRGSDEGGHGPAIGDGAIQVRGVPAAE